MVDDKKNKARHRRDRKQDRQAEQPPGTEQPIRPEGEEGGVSGAGGETLERNYEIEETISEVEASTQAGDEIEEDELFSLLVHDQDLEEYENSVSAYTTDEGIVEDFTDRQQIPGSAENLKDKLENYTQLSPNISAEDVDASWEYGNESGEETVGGTVPTPDQDIVEELGEAAGLTYRDDEPLNFDKVGERDVKRWELNPEDVAEIDDQNVESLDALEEEEVDEDELSGVNALDVEEDDEDGDEEDEDEDDEEDEEEDDDLEEDIDEFDLIDLDEDYEEDEDEIDEE